MWTPEEGSPSHFSSKSYQLIKILPDNQFAHVIIEAYYKAEVSSFRMTKWYLDQKKKD